MKHLLDNINSPLKQLDENFGNVKDDLECELLIQYQGPWFIASSIKANGNFTLDILRTIYSTSRAGKERCATGNGTMASFRSSFQQVEEGKCVFNAVAARHSGFWQEQASVSVRMNNMRSVVIANTVRSIVIEDAMKAFHAGQSPPPAFFYCSRNTAEPARSSPDAITASIARQLSSLQPGLPLLPPIVAAYKKREAEGFASGSLRMGESRALIIQLVEYYPLTTIVIDALDECDSEERADLLDTLKEILQESSRLVKIFVSSRDDQDIVLHLQDYPNLELGFERNMDDIASFVRAETQYLIRTQKLLRFSSNKEELKSSIIYQVTKGAGGM